MRILLDTNIFIPLEDSSIDIDETLTELNRMVSGKHQLLVHPATAIDLAKDKNTERRRKILARLNKYPKLESPPDFFEGEEEALMGLPKKDNDQVDNLILLAVHKTGESLFLRKLLWASLPNKRQKLRDRLCLRRPQSSCFFRWIPNKGYPTSFSQ
jgi:rRNA-processing protein FCF1